MKLYTDEIQTAKLIELGFEKPKGWYVDGVTNHINLYVNIDENPMMFNYSIGELIDFIPDTGSEFMRNRQIFGQGVRFYGERCIYDFDEEAELIDNLFNLVVRLKKNGEI